MATRPCPSDGAVTALAPIARASDDARLSAPSWSDWRTEAGAIEGWRDLADHSAQPNPFFAPWALPAALDAIEGADRTQMVQLRDEAALHGLLPITRQTMYYGRPLPHWCGWMHHNAFCGVPIVRTGHEHRFWSELLRWCDDNARGAVFLHLTHLPADGPIYAALRDVVREDQRPAAIVQREERALLRSDLSPEDYLAASMTAKKRKELRRQHRRLGEEGDLRFVRQRDGDALAEWTDQFLALEKSGWKGSEGSALACSPATTAIFRETLAGAAQAGALERLALTLDGNPIAMLANFRSPPGAFSYKTTYDERYARFSPGVLLQRENLDLLTDPAIEWTDSCAAADHPMIDSIWRERRTMLRVSIALGGSARRLLARAIFTAEAGAENQGLPAGTTMS